MELLVFATFSLDSDEIYTSSFFSILDDKYSPPLLIPSAKTPPNHVNPFLSDLIKLLYINLINLECIINTLLLFIYIQSRPSHFLKELFLCFYSENQWYL